MEKPSNDQWRKGWFIFWTLAGASVFLAANFDPRFAVNGELTGSFWEARCDENAFFDCASRLKAVQALSIVAPVLLCLAAITVSRHDPQSPDSYSSHAAFHCATGGVLSSLITLILWLTISGSVYFHDWDATTPDFVKVPPHYFTLDSVMSGDGYPLFISGVGSAVLAWGCFIWYENGNGYAGVPGIVVDKIVQRFWPHATKSSL